MGFSYFLLLVLVEVLATDAVPVNSVEVEFDLVTPQYWDTKVTQTFKDFIETYGNEYCASNASLCNIESDIKSSDVLFNPGYPKVKEIDTLLSFYVSDGNFHLPKQALASMVTQYRIEIQNELKAASTDTEYNAFRVAYVDGVLVLDPSDATLDKIAIPIICVGVVLIALGIIGLDYRSRQLAKKRALDECERRKLEKTTLTLSRDSTELFQAKKEPVNEASRNGKRNSIDNV